MSVPQSVNHNDVEIFRVYCRVLCEQDFKILSFADKIYKQKRTKDLEKLLHPAFYHQTEDTCQVSLPDVTKTLLTDVEIWVLRKCMSDRDNFVKLMKAAGLHTTNVDLCLELFHLATFLFTVN